MKYIICSFLILFTTKLSAQVFSEKEYESLDQAINSNQVTDVELKIDHFLQQKPLPVFDKAQLFKLKGKLHHILLQYEKSEKYYLKAINLFHLINNKEWDSKIRLNLSNLYMSQNQYTKATNELYKVQEYLDHVDNDIIKHNIALSYATLYYFNGNNKEAFNRLESMIKGIKDVSLLADLYNNLAVLYRKDKQYNKAIEYNSRALKINLRSKNELPIAMSYNNLGLNYENLNMLIEDIKLFSNSFTDSVDVYQNQIQHFDINPEINYTDSALYYYKLSIDIYKKYKNEWNTALANLAHFYEHIGNGELANQCLNEILNTSKGKKQYKNLEAILKHHLAVQIHKGNIDKIKYYYSYLDKVQERLSEEQSDDFHDMLENQKQLYEVKKAEKEQELKLIDEQNKRLVAEAEKSKILYDAKKTEKEQELKLIEEKNKRLLAETRNTRIRFVLLIIVAITIIGLLLFLLKVRGVKHKNEREKNMLKTKILRTQMNPHFIFNVLTAIQNTLLDNEPLKTSSYIAKFSRLIRQNFDFTNKDYITLTEELDALHNYIETQKVRFGDKFTYNIELDDELDTDKINIPPMLLQPIVENAIEHGLKHKKSDGLLQIVIHDYDKKIMFKVIDNGNGYKPKQSDGKEHSMDILKTRLHIPGYGDEKSLKIITLEEPSGTQVEFSLTIT